MKILQSIILTIAFVFSGILMNAQNKEIAFEYKKLPIEKTAHFGFDENYNTGVKYYNEAIASLKNVKELSSEELDPLNNRVIEKMKMALPYFEKAYKINSEDKNVLEALSGCYFSLNDQANFEKYRKERDAIK